MLTKRELTLLASASLAFSRLMDCPYSQERPEVKELREVAIKAARESWSAPDE